MYLNIKTEYNLYDSYVRLDELGEFVVENNLNAVAICDYATVQAFYKFNQLAKEKNFRPIFGVELVDEGQHIHLYAKNNIGIKRLNQLVTEYQKEKKINLYEKEADLIMVLGKGPIIDKIIKQDEKMPNKYESIFGEELYYGVFSYLNDSDNYSLFEIATKLKLPTVILDPVKYLSKDVLETYLTLKAIKKQKQFIHFAQLRIKALRYEVKTDYLEQFSEAINRSKEILDKCYVNLDGIKLKHPRYPFLEQDQTSKALFSREIEIGVKKRFENKINQKIVDRIKYEYEIICNMDYQDYFLIVQDVVKYVKENDIKVGPARGSAAGSLIAYILGITDINPLDYNLYFERFLNPERQTMPDIDLDFEGVYREKIIEYIKERYGTEHVVKIGTINRYLAKSAFRDVATVYGLDKKSIEIISKELKSEISIVENVMNNDKLNQIISSDQKLQTIMRVSNDIEGMPRSHSIHAAGIIIANEDVKKFSGLNYNDTTMLESNELEKMGLLKFDILALYNLTLIKNVVNSVQNKIPIFDIETIDLNNIKTYELLNKTQTFGVFQMESRGMKEVISKVKPQNYDELALVLALYRPGSKSQVDEYVANKTTYRTTDKIGEILAESKGILVYQEQLMQLVQVMAGYTLAQADLFRRAISKKNTEKMSELTKEFTEKALANGYQNHEVNKISSLISKFGGYGFNKSHAYSYARITYQLAYLKANFPIEFYEQIFIQNFKGSNTQEFLAELSAQGLTLRGPHIKYSDYKVSIIKNNIVLGFEYIKGISRETAHKIINARENLENYNDFENVITKLVKETELTKNEINALVDAGTLDAFGYNHPTLIENINDMLVGDVSNIAQLFGEPILVKEKPDISLEEKAKKEIAVLGINIKYSIFDEVRRQLQARYKRRVYGIREAKVSSRVDQTPGNSYLVTFKIDTIKEITTKNNDIMAFLKVASQGEYDITVFPDTYKKLDKKIADKQGKYVLAIVNFKQDKIYLEKMEIN